MIPILTSKPPTSATSNLLQAELESRTEEEVAELEAAVLKALPQVGP